MTGQTDPVAGRIALVTGASSGIGAAVARKLLERGAHVVGLALDEVGLAQTFAGAGPRGHTVTCDLSRTDQIDAVVHALPAAFRPIDLLVNCAGHDVGGRVRFDAAKPSDVANVIGVNLLALMLMSRAVLPEMIARGAADIVNIGSIASKSAVTNLVTYATSKYGVHGFSEALRHDLEETDVRVIEVLPGPVKTNFATARFHGDTAKGSAYYENRQTLTPDHVAQTVLWAISQDPAVTLSEIVVVPTRRL